MLPFILFKKQRSLYTKGNYYIDIYFLNIIKIIQSQPTKLRVKYKKNQRISLMHSSISLNTKASSLIDIKRNTSIVYNDFKTHQKFYCIQIPNCAHNFTRISKTSIDFGKL